MLKMEPADRATALNDRLFAPFKAPSKHRQKPWKAAF
jgi:hypothetical protein